MLPFANLSAREKSLAIARVICAGLEANNISASPGEVSAFLDRRERTADEMFVEDFKPGALAAAAVGWSLP